MQPGMNAQGQRIKPGKIRISRLIGHLSAKELSQGNLSSDSGTVCMMIRSLHITTKKKI
jgi:hypothetical protein